MPTTTEPGSFEKQEAEKITIAIEYVNRLPSGATVVSGVCSGINLTTNAADNTIFTSTTATISGTQAKVQVIGGTRGTTYKVTVTTTFSNGDILEDDVEMQVVAK